MCRTDIKPFTFGAYRYLADFHRTTPVTNVVHAQTANLAGCRMLESWQM